MITLQFTHDDDVDNIVGFLRENQVPHLIDEVNEKKITLTYVEKDDIRHTKRGLCIHFCDKREYDIDIETDIIIIHNEQIICEICGTYYPEIRQSVLVSFFDNHTDSLPLSL